MLGDLKFALRMLRRSPGVTAAAIIALALGIGANTAIFSVVDGVLLRPLPYPESDALVAVITRAAAPSSASTRRSRIPSFKDLPRRTHALRERRRLGRRRHQPLGRRLARARAHARSPRRRCLPTLRVQPVARPQLPAEEQLKGNDHVVMLDYGAVASGASAAPPTTVGKSCASTASTYQIVGVLPRGFSLRSRRRRLDCRCRRRSTSLEVARRALPARDRAPRRRASPRRSIAADLAALSQRLTETLPDIYPPSTGWRSRAQPYLDDVVGDVRLPLLVLLGAVALRAAHRLRQRRQPAARARGDAPARDGHSHRARRRPRAAHAPAADRERAARRRRRRARPRASPPGASTRLVGAGARRAAARRRGRARRARARVHRRPSPLATGVAFGLMPALSASRPDLHDALKDGTRGTTVGRGRLRNALVVAEVALSLVLLVGAGLMVRSFVRLRDVDPGFRADHALTLSVSLPVARQHDDRRRSRALRRASSARRRAAGAAARRRRRRRHQPLPLAATSTDRLVRHRRLHARRRPRQPDSEMREVAGDWFAAMGIPLVARPRLLPRATRRRAACRRRQPGVGAKVLADREALGRRDPVGRRLARRAQATAPWATIVGVVGDVRSYGLDQPPLAEMYWPLPQQRDASDAVAGRAHRAAIRARSPARRARAIAEIDRAAADLRRAAARRTGRDVAGAAPLHADADAAVRPRRAGARRRRHLRRHGLHRRATHAGDRHPRGARRHARRRCSAWCCATA